MPLSNIPINKGVVDEIIDKYGISDLGKATIREISSIVNDIEKATGVEFIRMEMGVPGLPPSQIGVNAQIQALNNGVASKYPLLEGEKVFKAEAARFMRAFANIDLHPKNCIPTVGSMQGSFAAFLTISKLDPYKNTILFINPGFPVQKIQLQTLEIPFETFDVYHYRGSKLRKKLNKYLERGNIAAIVYSNPNNPAWICFKEEELKIIGELANQHDVIVIEDLAYFGMDFRADYAIPFKSPYQPTIAHYCNNYILLVSSSKTFSYAGERIALMVISELLQERQYQSLSTQFGMPYFGRYLVGRVLYSLSAGVSHSAQLALTAIYKAASDGEYNFIKDVSDYGKRAKAIKELFTKWGFTIIYNRDVDEPIADGFYFTVNIDGMYENELIHLLLYHGISAIPLHSTGSDFDGVRICVSQTSLNKIDDLNLRLKALQNSRGK